MRTLTVPATDYGSDEFDILKEITFDFSTFYVKKLGEDHAIIKARDASACAFVLVQSVSYRSKMILVSSENAKTLNFSFVYIHRSCIR